MENPKLKIMIVEDEVIFALDTKNTLQKLGYEVTGIASNYNDTVACVERNKPDLMLMDISIKGSINGIDTAKYLMEVHKIPSLFLTAYNDNETREKVSLIHSIGILFKPLDDIQFREIMQDFEQKLHLQ
jgi:DNA-binding NarL/FixJ family response regulator